MKRIFSAILALTLTLGLFANLSLGASATTTASDFDYLTSSFRNADAKIATMEKYIENDKYEFYVENTSGEFAVKNKLTGQTFLSNPYDVAKSGASDEMKQELLSQVLIKYTDSGVDKAYNSFKDCVKLNQIKVKHLKNGVRVEYTIGNEETRKLVPMQISQERFESVIYQYVEEGSTFAADRLKVLYDLKDINDPTLTVKGKQELVNKYPIVEQFPIYVFATDAKDQEIIRAETWIKTYCPQYSFEDLEYDYEIVGYEAQNKAPAVFKLALEYTLDENGFSMRFGANGLRFDESNFTLKEIAVLPYAGAGTSSNSGYLFVPDGSGTIMRFEDITSSVVVSGKMYGQDYAYHKITGTTEKQVTMPVYGLAQAINETTMDPETGNVVSKPVWGGYFAIIEEGDTLVNVRAETGGTVHPYNTIYTVFNPRPSDTYSINDAVSSGTAEWTVVSERKYTGNFKLKYYLLEDSEKAANGGSEKTYEASYVGMAKAYRDYLTEKGVLTPLANVKDDVPLYLESFGTVDTQEKVLSFPVTEETPLTTFEDLKTMTGELREGGVRNINLRLTGFVNGGLYSLPPTKADFQSEVGGDSGFKEFTQYAKDNNIGVYTDFDFVFLHNTGWFDGFSYSNNAVKTIDGRYTQRQQYYSDIQSLGANGEVVMSVSSLKEFYLKVKEDLEELGATGISAATLGKYLNSDFNTDAPYNREDARYETAKVLGLMKQDFGGVMTDAGNAYTWQYADHILNVALDSSRFINTSQAIPFVGMVLHGSVEFAGEPLNTAGDIDYEILKMIENGASPYFKLSYRNAEKLKEDMALSQYYSVRYDIWKEDLIKYYNEINEALKDVQTATIENHEFVEASRIPGELEKKEDEEALAEATEKNETEKRRTEEKERRAALLEEKLAARELLNNPPETNADGEETTQATETTQTTETTETAEEPTEETPAEEEELIDLTTKYLTQTGTVVKVTYSNGKTFILNYNNFDITCDGVEVPSLGFKVVK